MSNCTEPRDSGQEAWAQFEDAVLASGFTQIPNAVTRNPTLSMQAKFIYGLILSYAWQDAECFPGQAKLREDTGAKVDTIRKYIHELVDAGLLGVKRRGLGKTNIYTFKTVKALSKGDNPDSPQRGASDSPQAGVSKTAPNGGHYEYTEDKDPNTNPTGGKETLNPVAVENRTQSQLLTDDFCRRLRARERPIRLEQDQYGFHLGSFRNMLEKDEPTDQEIDRVIAHMVEVFPSAPKIRATKALQDVRLERDTGEAWNKPAPWEAAQEERREKSYYEKKYPTQPQKLPKELAALAEENRRLEAEMLKDVI